MDDTADLYVMNTNMDLTEGRGGSRPCGLFRHLGNALDEGRTAGVMGTHSGVTANEAFYESGPTLGTVGRRVIGSFRDGTGAYQWGVIPANIAPLNDEEKARLAALRKELGDLAPTREYERGDEGEAVGVIWHRAVSSVALSKASTEVIVGLVRVSDAGDPREALAAVRRQYPELPLLHYTVVKTGELFTLRAGTADAVEPTGVGALPETDRAALIEEYRELATKAGLL